MLSTLLVELSRLLVGRSAAGQSKSHDDVDDMEIGMTLSRLADVDVIESSNRRQQVVVVDPEDRTGSGTRFRIKINLVEQQEVAELKKILF